MLAPVVVQLLAGMLMTFVELIVETREISVIVAETELVRSKVTVEVPGAGVREEVMLAVGVRLEESV